MLSRAFGKIFTLFIIAAILAFRVSGWAGIVAVAIAIYFIAQVFGVLGASGGSPGRAEGCRKKSRGHH
jgi:hypothetical protein